MKLSVMSRWFANALRTGDIGTAAVVRYVWELGVKAVELMDSFGRDDQLGSAPGGG
jgi:hypothetical protein